MKNKLPAYLLLLIAFSGFGFLYEGIINGAGPIFLVLVGIYLIKGIPDAITLIQELNRLDKK